MVFASTSLCSKEQSPELSLENFPSILPYKVKLSDSVKLNNHQLKAGGLELRTEVRIQVKDLLNLVLSSKVIINSWFKMML